MSKALVESAVTRNATTKQKEVSVMKPVLEVKSVLENVPDLVLVNPATYLTVYGAGFTDTGPLKRRLDSGAFVVVSEYVPVGEVHIMRGSSLIEKLTV